MITMFSVVSCLEQVMLALFPEKEQVLTTLFVVQKADKLPHSVWVIIFFLLCSAGFPPSTATPFLALICMFIFLMCGTEELN